MFVLAVGSCEVVVIDNDSGEDKVVATINAPCYFGEMALIEKKPRMATVRCVGQCELFEILADDFMRLVGSSAEALDAAMEEAAKRKAQNEQSVSRNSAIAPDTLDLEDQTDGLAAPLLQPSAN